MIYHLFNSNLVHSLHKYGIHYWLQTLLSIHLLSAHLISCRKEWLKDFVVIRFEHFVGLGLWIPTRFCPLLFLGCICCDLWLYPLTDQREKRKTCRKWMNESRKKKLWILTVIVCFYIKTHMVNISKARCTFF